MNRGAPPLARMRGAALVEFVVLALVWIPLFLLVPRLGKLLDLYRTTESASRYAAFEASVHHSANGWKSDNQLATELRQRLFATAQSEQAVRVDSATLRRNVIFSAAVQARHLKLPNDNRYRVSVTVDPTRLPGLRPFDRMNLDTTRQTVLLVDTWAAAGPHAVRRRVEGAHLLVPTQAVQPLMDAFGLLPTLLFDPRMRLGDFDWDGVPCDRLEPGCR